MTQLRIIIITLLSLLAFAANSLITRFALMETTIDETSFIMLRVVSGALFLWLYSIFKKVKAPHRAGSWSAAIALFIYATSFTYGYGLVAAGTGALLLFGSVQITMTMVGYSEGERLNKVQLAGFVLALLGLVILMLPGISAPSFFGAILMCTSGVAWSVYTLQGRGASNPASATAGNFIKSAPLVISLWLVVNFYNGYSLDLTSTGVIYALLSGIVTSGMGYIIWYTVLPELKATQAAIVQLSVPLLVTFTGILVLDEAINLRIFIASFAILLGTLLVLKFKQID